MHQHAIKPRESQSLRSNTVKIKHNVKSRQRPILPERAYRVSSAILKSVEKISAVIFRAGRNIRVCVL
jgi:hypothetical protein